MESLNRKFASALGHNHFSLELPLAKNVQVMLDGRKVTWPLASGELENHEILGVIGIQASVRLADDLAEVKKIDLTLIDFPSFPLLKAVDAVKKTVSLTLNEKTTLEGLPADGAQIIDQSGRRIGFEDLLPGMHVSVEMEAKDGLIVVARIQRSRS